MSESWIKPDQWLTNGICNECRRQNYCKTRCRANKAKIKQVAHEAYTDFLRKKGLPVEFFDSEVKPHG